MPALRAPAEALYSVEPKLAPPPALLLRPNDSALSLASLLGDRELEGLGPSPRR